MPLEVRIPFDLDRNKLGAAYNREMETVKDWALFLDHDTYLVNPNWYRISVDAIGRLGYKAGLITCRTNAVGCPHQRIGKDGEISTQDMDIHLKIAQNREKQYPHIYTDVTDVEYPISGFFMITHKSAWKNCGGFVEGFLGIDNEYHRSVRRLQYKVFVMEELYCYHRYARFWKEA